MRALVVWESCFGNTAAVADAIVTGLRDAGVDVEARTAGEDPEPEGFDLLVVGAPTHNMGLPRPASRAQAAASGARSTGAGVAEWLDRRAPERIPPCALFATVTGTGVFSGSAAKAMRKRLRRTGATVLAREEFVVTGREGPLRDGERDRALGWGASLAQTAAHS
ncbi:flavodoxin/nitric oxide synthase [Rhodococcus rhodnii]|nr:flavodoxin domain-containing protein [Rhodococcus rhodnii]TXG90997.1 flavodoxin/nitric oxide synthase [Rhodococcus rhodnii]